MPTRSQIIACARGYMGTPFQPQGRLKGKGVDCAGLVLCVCKDLGADLPYGEYLNYEPYSTDDSVLRACKKVFKEIPLADLRPGDILCMRTPVPCHVGMVTDLQPGLGVIHALNSNRKVVEHTLDFHWHRRIAGVFLFPGVED